MIGRRIEVEADLDRIRCSPTAGLWPTTTGSGPNTKPSPCPSTALPPTGCARDRIGLVCPAVDTEVETRRLIDYDTALGLTDHHDHTADDHDGDDQAQDGTVA